MSIPFVELFHPSKEVSIFVLNFLSSRKTLIHLVFTEEHFSLVTYVPYPSPTGYFNVISLHSSSKDVFLSLNRVNC